MPIVQQPGHGTASNKGNAPVDVIVIHETSGVKYLEALTFLRSQHALRSVQFVGASVVWKFFHTLFRERKGLKSALRTSLENLAFRLKLWKVRDHVVILCVAPWDYRFLLFAFLWRKNRLIYNTSWPYWTGSKVPRKFGPLTPVIRAAWLLILSEIEIVTVISAAAKSLSSVADLKRPPIIISHTVSEVFFKVQARHSVPLRLLFVGELSAKKGVRELPKLLDALSDQSVAIDIVGDGPLRQIAIEIAQRPNCRWHGQITDRLKLAAIAANCQILVSPSSSTNRWEELFGMSILEAMASGLVCIVTDHVGPRSIIRSGVDGILMPENSTHAIAALIRELQCDPRRWTDISKCAIATAKRYSLQEIAGQWNRLLAGTPKGDPQQAPVKEQSSTQVLASAKFLSVTNSIL